MASSLEKSWEGAEQKIFGWFIEKLGADYNKNAFIAEVPSAFPLASTQYVWLFEINGGGRPVDYGINVDTPGSFSRIQTKARFVGIFVSRTTAMQIAGKIRDLLPINNTTIQGVERLLVAEEPMIERAVIDVEADVATGEKGGERRFWQLTIGLEVVFMGTEV